MKNPGEYVDIGDPALQFRTDEDGNTVASATIQAVVLWKEDIENYIMDEIIKMCKEQVEKVWRGEWNYSHTTETDHFAVVKCSKCGHEAFAIALYVKDENFCPHCGAPMTDEAVQMVMERLEALKDGRV